MSVEIGLGLVLLFVIFGIVIGLPIAFVFGYGGLGFFLIVGTADPSLLMPSSIKLMQGFTFLALPLYIMLGKLMEVGVLSDRLLAFLKALLGKGKAMFGGTVVVFCAVFGAISGSAGSAICAIGSIVIPKGEEQGYDRQYTTGVVGTASLISMLIPPSLSMIIFGVVGRLSIATCFLSTAVPGILITLFYLVINFFLTRRITPVSQPSVAEARGKEILQATKRGVTVLMLPVIILGGIYGGVFTPTEAAAVGLVWIILDGLLIHREAIPRFKAGFLEAGKIIGAIAALCFFIFMLSRAMIWLNVPDLLMSFTTTLVHAKITFLIMANVLVLLMGMIMDDISCCILCGILLLPIAIHFGVDPYHFAAIVGVNTGIANLTPPVAPNLYIAASIGNVPVDLYPPNRLIKTVFWYLLFGHLPVLILVTYIPEISLFLPTLWAG